jgi:hypothetical protein
LLGIEWSTNDAYQWILTISPFLDSHYGAMDVGNNRVGVRNVVLKLRNDCMGAYDTVMNVGNDTVGVRNIMLNVGDDCMGVRDIALNVGNNCVGV